MKKPLAILTALFALTFLSAAQTGSSSSGSQGGSDQGSTSMHSEHHKGGGNTLTGCLQGSQGAYTLKHGSKEVPVTSSEDLSAHVGHQVKLHGSWASAGSSDSATPSSTGEKGSKDRTFNATSVDHVSDTCSGSSESGEHHHHKGSDSGSAGTGQSNPPPKQ